MWKENTPRPSSGDGGLGVKGIHPLFLLGAGVEGKPLDPPQEIEGWGWEEYTPWPSSGDGGLG